MQFEASPLCLSLNTSRDLKPKAFATSERCHAVISPDIRLNRINRMTRRLTWGEGNILAVGRSGLLASIPTFRGWRVFRYGYFTDLDRRPLKYKTKL